MHMMMAGQRISTIFIFDSVWLTVLRDEAFQRRVGRSSNTVTTNGHSIPPFSPDIRRIADRFGGFSVPLRRAARKFNRWLARPVAKSLGLPPQRAGAHRAALIRAHLDPHPCHICSRCPLMPVQAVHAVGRSATGFRRTAGGAPRPRRAGT